jgi:5-methylcytosine-specific restriction endonuclease McrBC GTP-binding regulatory subunit McrB
MHLPYGRGEQKIDSVKMLQENPPVIGTGEWDDIQCLYFKGENGGLKIGDIILVREGAKPLALCQIESESFEDSELENKYLHTNFRNVKILEWANDMMTNFPQPQKTLQILYERSSSDSWNYINDWNKKVLRMKTINEFIAQLKENKNLILTGAPGTGKTFLAKQIAEQMNAESAFVQFHPSYDYTDFVEGLRPTSPDKNGNIGFELKNGVFKEYCEKARITYLNNFDSQFEQFINDIIETPLKLQTPVQKRSFSIEVDSNKTCYAIPETEKATRMGVTKKMLREYVENNKITDLKSYTIAIGDYFKEKYSLTIELQENSTKSFVFIIDEINRGEISKIFGELFFSIDPSYRGEKGKVKTQYANMHPNEEEFYIPENVYIIGTMNDIDRSVESFDFAMRRRFTWVEITAEESAENMNLSDTCKERMKSVNNEISKVEGLNTSYHIGGAYFLDKEGKEIRDFKKLWSFRLKPLLFEYLRGMSDADAILDKLEKAYNLAENNDADNG